MSKRYEEILSSGYTRALRRSGLLPRRGTRSSRQSEGVLQAVFPQPDGDRNFWPDETWSEFLHTPWGWTLGWWGSLAPGGWNGPGPTGRALSETLSLNVSLPHDIPPEEFDPVGEYVIDSSDAEIPAFASYELRHDLSEHGWTRLISFPVPTGWIRVTRLGNGNLAGQFELSIPLSPIKPASFEPEGTPDYEPPEFVLTTRNGMFVFPPTPIPGRSVASR